MAVGLVKTDEIFYAAATGVGRPIVYLGSKTGRDGIHGATMASAEFDADSDEKRPTVQVGDPFSEKLLLEACLEIMARGCVVAIQDMGAAGLTSSAVEMGAKGNLGIELDLDKVPCRERGMTAYEMMLSESQERMLMVLDPDKEAEAESIFRKWGLDFAVIGKTTDTLRFVVKHGGEVKVDLPIKELGDEAPLYDRPHVPTPKQPKIDSAALPAPLAMEAALQKLVSCPDMASKRWVWEQYDHLILGNTIVGPGGDAAVIRIDDGPKGLALTTDVTARYCYADPKEGGKQAVAEAWRNITAVGGLPRALTDNLNFGNPEKPEIMGQFVGCLEGVGEACRALDFPIVSGNVSLYNETQGKGIMPTPAIGGVGLVPDVTRAVGVGFRASGEKLVLIGEGEGWLGQSLYLREILGREEGAPPPVDLAAERRNGDFVRDLISRAQVSSVHDLSDGGLAVAVAEMAMAGKIGATVCAPGGDAPQNWFGEDQGRYLLAVSADKAEALLSAAKAAGVPAAVIGETGGETLNLGASAPVLVRTLLEAHESWMPAYMAGGKT
jgi:phosphoribosylformylglycinamidine synthase